jgi:hypothetical protein
MKTRLSHLTAIVLCNRLASSALVLASITLLAACAPGSAVRSVDTTGYNGFIRKIGAECQPLLIGSKDVGEMIRLENAGNDNGYDFFLDISSKLYYNRISFAAYRENLTAFFGTGTGNDAAFACIQRHLAAQRPNAPY